MLSDWGELDMETAGDTAPNRSYGARQAPITSDDQPDPHSRTQVLRNLGVAPDDLAFARQEARRCKMDVASVLIAYGMISADAYCCHASQVLDLPYLRGEALARAAAVCAPSAIAQISQTGRIPASWTLNPAKRSLVASATTMATGSAARI